MFDIKLALVSALVMFLFEYFVLLKVYTRSQKLRTISLIFAPLMIIIALYISHILQTYTNLFIKSRLDPIALFVSFALLELPLSIMGYDISPNAPILERVIVASSFGTISVLVAQGILKY